MKSQNGWTASENRAEIGVKNYEVAGTSRHLACSSKVAPILCAFASEFHTKVEPIDEGIFDEWGYAFRVVRGSDGSLHDPTMKDLSNHASGTAIDLNASKHPLGKKGTFNAKQVSAIHALVAKYGIRWGGDYHGRIDEMHFEIVEMPAQVSARIKSMKLTMPKEHK